MRRILKPTILLAAVALAACAVPAAAALPGLSGKGAPAAGGTFVPGEVIVRFESGTTASERLAVRRTVGVELEQSLRVSRAQLVEADGGVLAAVKRLQSLPDVAYAQPNYRYRALAPPPDDTFFADLWGLQDPAAPNPGVDALAAWDVTRGAGQVIAVVDTGVAPDHPDIEANLWTGPGGIHGFDFVDDDADPDDYNFHGTHVAGTAAATDDNALGIAGVAPDAQIMAIRALDGDGSGSSADIGDGIAFAAQNGADVVNLSLGGPSGAGDAFMSSAVDVANLNDVVVVAAAGNEDNDNDANPTTPCTLPQPNLICVAAVTQAGALASFSNHGATTVDVGAPGTGILSAKADYSAPLFTEGFDGGLGAWSTPAGSTAWGTSSTHSVGTLSAADSPAGSYANDADVQMVKTTGLNLTGQRGCRMHFDLRYALEFGFDELLAGAIAPGDLQDTAAFTGSSGGFFEASEASISDLDGLASVSPAFALFSDESITDDGVYVDDLEVLCRDDTYLDDKTAAGNYVQFNGTSMATPHVAGVAALVRAADPGVPDTQVVDSIKAGGAPLASLSGFTVSGRTADADGAIAAALAAPNTPQPAAPAPVPSPQPKAQTSSPPAKPNLTGAKSAVRVSRKGILSYSFKATPGLIGEALFRTRKKAVVSRRAHLAIGSKSFAVPSTGRVTVKIKLSKKSLRTLRRNRKLLLNATVTVRNLANLSSQATKRLTLKPPRRR